MTVFKDTNRLAEAAIIMADEILMDVKPVLVPGSVRIYDSGPLKEFAEVTPEGTTDQNKKYVCTFVLDPNPTEITKDNLDELREAGHLSFEEIRELNAVKPE